MTETLSIDGIHCYYKGNIKQGAVVFIHGNSLNACIFREQFLRLSEFPLLAIDLPGHGQSERAKDGEQFYNIPAYARAVAAIIRELELENFILAGHSMGGNIAIEAASLLLGIKGLMLINTTPFSKPPQLDKMCRSNPFLGYFLSGSLEPVEAILLAGEMLQGNTLQVKNLSEYILQADDATRMGFAASLGMEKFSDEFGLLETFHKPLAVLCGKRDRFVNPDYLSIINPVSLWKNAIIELNAGHLPQMEMPDAFNTVMKEFYAYAHGIENREEKHLLSRNLILKSTETHGNSK